MNLNVEYADDLGEFLTNAREVWESRQPDFRPGDFVEFTLNLSSRPVVWYGEVSFIRNSSSIQSGSLYVIGCFISTQVSQRAGSVTYSPARGDSTRVLYPADGPHDESLQSL